MPKLKISLETLADTVNELNHHDKEALLILLAGHSGTLLKRKRDIETKKVKSLSRSEVFGV